MGHETVKPRVSQLFLHSGKDFQITEAISVRHPKIEDILGLGGGALCEDIYWSYVFTLLSDPYDHMVWLEDHGMDYEHVTAFQVFALRWLDAQEEYIKHADEYNALGFRPDSIYSEALSFFFGKHKYTLRCGDNVACLMIHADAPGWHMDEGVFECAAYFIQEINCIDRSDKIHPATASAKKILIEDKRDEMKRQSKKKQDAEPLQQLASATTTVLFGDTGNISPFDLPRLSVYHLLAGAAAINKRMVVHAMLNGIHTGMIKIDKMPMEALRWT